MNGPSNMKSAADYIKNNFKPDEMVLCIMEGPLNCSWQASEECVNWDKARYMIDTLTDDEVCGDDEFLFYFTIGKAYMINGDDAFKGMK